MLIRVVAMSKYCISMWECVTTKLSNDNINNKDKDLLKEVTIKLPETTYSTAFAISILRNYNTIEDYISDLKIAVIFSIAMRIIL